MSECKVTRRKGLVKQDPIVITDSEEDASPLPSQIVSNKALHRPGSRSTVSIDLPNDDQPSLSTIESISTPHRPITHSVSTTSSTSTNASADIASIFDEDEDPNDQSSPLSPPEEPEGFFSYDTPSRTGLQAGQRRSRSRGNEPGVEEQRGKSIQDDHCDSNSPSEKRGLRMKNANAKAAGRIKSPRFASSLPVRGTNEPMEETLPRTRSAQTSQVGDGKDAPSPQLPQVKRCSPRSSIGGSRKVPSPHEGTKTKNEASVNIELELPSTQPAGIQTEDKPSINVESEQDFSQPECDSKSESDNIASSGLPLILLRYKQHEKKRYINSKIQECLQKQSDEGKKLKGEKSPDGETTHPNLGWVYILKSPKAPGHVKIGKSKNEPSGRKKAISKCFADLEESEEGHENGYPYFGLVESIVHQELHNTRKVVPCQNCSPTGETKGHQEWFEVSEKDAARCIEKWRCWLKDYEPFDRTGKLTPYWERRVETLTTKLANVDWDTWTIPSSDGYWTSDYRAYWSERYMLTAVTKRLDRKIPKMWVLILHILFWYDNLIGIIAGIAGLIWL